MTKRFTRVICSNDEYTGSLYCNDDPLKIEEVCTLLNELHEEKEQLQHDATILIQSNQDYRKENEQLKQSNQKLNDELQETMGYLALKSGVEKENEELKQRNNRQAKQLDRIYQLIEEKDWRTLNDILDDFKQCEKQLQREWRTYE